MMLLIKCGLMLITVNSAGVSQILNDNSDAFILANFKSYLAKFSS